MNLVRSVLRVLFSVAIVWWGVATATFILMKSIPGGPLSQERTIPPAAKAAIEAKYRLNDPPLVQYGNYLLEAATFRFGVSFENRGRTVGEIILQRLPRSAALGAYALSLALVVAFSLGIAAALDRGGFADRLLSFVATAGVSVPSFILGSILLYWLSFRFKLFSTGWARLSDAVLPAISLAALPTAYLARLIRAGLAEVMSSEFMLAARARGLSRFEAVARHGIPHTLAPVLAYLGPQAAAVMTGSFVVEQIFNIPGLGLMYVKSIGNRDYPMIMGVTLVYTIMLVLFNLLSDLASRMIDPRLK